MVIIHLCSKNVFLLIIQSMQNNVYFILQIKQHCTNMNKLNVEVMNDSMLMVKI